MPVRSSARPPDAPPAAGRPRGGRLRVSPRARRWALVALYMAGIFVLSAMPQPPLPQDVSDKTAHIAAYAGLAVVVVRALADGLPARVGWRTAGLALAITIGYGVSDEIHQMFVAGRFADPYDVLADAVGAAAGVGLCWAWGIIRFARPARLPRPAPRRVRRS